MTGSGLASPPSESQVLIEWGISLDNPEILTSGPAAWTGTVCSAPNKTNWFGVTCANGRVATIRLEDNSLSGTLPSSWSILSGLTELSLSADLTLARQSTANTIKGTLPESWSNMTSLGRLLLAQNELTGTLPETWGNMTCLFSLDLNQNNLTGTLPDSWAKMTSMQDLTLTSNHLTGTLPSSWAGMSSMRSLELSNNSFTGTLPFSWANLVNMSTLDLGANVLTGPIPPPWTNLGQLDSIYLLQNRLTGTIPQYLFSMKKLQKISLNSNKLTGTLPRNMASAEGLSDIFLRGNNLSGPLPGAWHDMHTIDFGNNKFTGTLPQAWSNQSSLGELFLNDNVLTGAIPEAWSNMTSVYHLNLWNNSLTGTLPSAWSQISSVGSDLYNSSIFLGSNKIRGSLPPSWAGIRRLSGLGLSYNALTGTLPTRWSDASSLSVLSLTGNELRGTLPSQWSTMTSLSRLYLSNNKFTGSLPLEWSKLTSLSEFEASENNLTGSLPAEWAQPYFRTVNLSGNALTGTLPAQWLYLGSGFAKKISSLDLSNNILHGSIPTGAGGNFLTSVNSSQPAAAVIVDPMKGSGMCGAIPTDMNITTSSGHALHGVMPGGACPDVGSGRNLAVIIGSSVGAGAAVVLLAAMSITIWLFHNKKPVPTRFSRGALLQLGLSSPRELKFELDKSGNPILLGKGAFGEVYKARWHGTLVAAKILVADELSEVDTFKRECIMLEQLHHLHIVRYFDHVIAENGMTLLVTELMQGGDLSGRIRRDTAVPRKTGWYQHGRYIALGVARGLVFLHSKGIIWFDCKPSNILLDHTGKVAKIADFGLAKVLLSTKTAGCLRGTPGYIAPELMGVFVENGEQNPGFMGDCKVDVYGFGHVLWQIITGETRPRGVENCRVPRVPEECPQKIMELQQACTRFQANRRPTAMEVMRVIEGSLLDIPGAMALMPGLSLAIERQNLRLD